MAEFVNAVGAERKALSHHGVLPIRGEKDYATATWPTTFDPINAVYAAAVCWQAVPLIQELCCWVNRPNDITLGDCIECLLAFDDAGRELQVGDVCSRNAADFFREMSYAYYRVNRVLSWNAATTRTPGLVGLSLAGVAPGPFFGRRRSRLGRDLAPLAVASAPYGSFVACAARPSKPTSLSLARFAAR